jgi:hypothetical protein
VFDFGSVLVGFMVDKMALRQVFLGIFWVTAGFIIPPVLRIHSSVTDSVQLAITCAQRERERGGGERWTDRQTDRDNSLLVLQFISTGVLVMGH